VRRGRIGYLDIGGVATVIQAGFEKNRQ